MLTGIALALAPVGVAAAQPSEVQRQALIFFAASDGRSLISAFNAVMAAPAQDMDDLIVKLRVSHRFQEMAGGWTLDAQTAHAICRDVARIGGVR
jgi:hypothetical protein